MARRTLPQAVRERTRTFTARWDAAATVRPPDEDPHRVERLLVDAGIDVRPWAVPEDGFRAYLAAADYPSDYWGGGHGGDPFFGQKALEHYVSLELGEVGAGDVLVDVASNGGPFVGIAERDRGCRCYENDLQFPPGVDGTRIGGDAASMPVDDGFADVMTLHCSFDHFEGASDTGFVREAGRVLRLGGRVVVVPLYLTDTYGAKVDPRLRLPGLELDEGMLRFLMPGLQVRFSRLYDPAQLRARVLEPAREAGLEAVVLRVTGGADLVPGSYLNFALVLRKPA